MTPHPFGRGTLFIEPFAGDGLQNGILLQHHEGLPKVYATVLAVNDSREGIKPGDEIVMVPHAYDEIAWSGGTVTVMNEASVRGVFAAQPEAYVPYCGDQNENGITSADDESEEIFAVPGSSYVDDDEYEGPHFGEAGYV